MTAEQFVEEAATMTAMRQAFADAKIKTERALSVYESAQGSDKIAALHVWYARRDEQIAIYRSMIMHDWPEGEDVLDSHE